MTKEQKKEIEEATLVTPDPIVDTLPVKLSELLGVALQDLKAAEMRKDIKVDMDVWLEMENEDDVEDPHRRCCVCLAGASLLSLTGGDYSRFAGFYGSSIFDSLPRTVQVKMLAINELRRGRIVPAYQTMDLDFPAEYPKLYGRGNLFLELVNAEERNVRYYEDDPGGFREDMERLLRFLKEKGL